MRAGLGSRGARASAGRGHPKRSYLLLAFAALFGAIAWRRERKNSDNVTYADVAGALTLIGLFAAATIEPEQLVRLVGDGSK